MEPRRKKPRSGKRYVEDGEEEEFEILNDEYMKYMVQERVD